MSENFRNIMAVVEHLNGAGWKIGKSAAYLHKKEGKLTPEADGTFSPKAVDTYAKRWLERLDGSGSFDELQEKTAQATLKKLEAQAKHWDIKTNVLVGDYVHRNQWDRELASRARVFKSDMQNFIRSRASEIIRLVDGNAEKVPELIEFYLAGLELWLDRYSKPKTWKVKVDVEEFEEETE